MVPEPLAELTRPIDDFRNVASGLAPDAMDHVAQDLGIDLTDDHDVDVAVGQVLAARDRAENEGKLDIVTIEGLTKHGNHTN